MAAVLHGGRSPMGLVDILGEFECVTDARAHLESDDVEHDGAWVEVVIAGPIVPADVLSEISRSEYAISPPTRQDDERCVVELVQDTNSS